MDDISVYGTFTGFWQMDKVIASQNESLAPVDV